MNALSPQLAKQRSFFGDRARWAAVAKRDPKADGAFVYSVATTGVYCRPVCPARLAKRCNVAFHDTCEAAAKAGFRPCRRCKPQEASRHQRETGLIADACLKIETAETPPSLDALAKYARLSRFHFHRLFVRITGLTPKAFAAAKRNERVRDELLVNGTTTSAIYAAGYNSANRFYSQSHAVLGMTPRQYRSGGKNNVIRFAISECSLGLVLTAATSKGLCAVLLGDSAGVLEKDLQRRFPNAELESGDADFAKLCSQVTDVIDAPGSRCKLPLDIQGTVFQHKVWMALRDIPPSSTITYSELAKRIGKPGSVRAVANACGANPLAIIVPCHRVVRSTGEISGYRWGIDRKRMLLEQEARLPARRQIRPAKKSSAKT